MSVADVEVRMFPPSTGPNTKMIFITVNLITEPQFEKRFSLSTNVLNSLTALNNSKHFSSNAPEAPHRKMER